MKFPTSEQADQFLLGSHSIRIMELLYVASEDSDQTDAQADLILL